MANISVLNMEGKEVGTLELNDAIFAAVRISFISADCFAILIFSDKEREKRYGS